jgi:mono/diheme cytochrome c family protein
MLRFLAAVLVVLPAPAQAASPATAPVDRGATVYREVCQACHMADARGAVGAGRIAALSANHNLQYPEYPIAIVTGGKGQMPWFRGELSDADIAAVITYIRRHFGNRYSAGVSEADVARLGKPAPRTGDER